MPIQPLRARDGGGKIPPGLPGQQDTARQSPEPGSSYPGMQQEHPHGHSYTGCTKVTILRCCHIGTALANSKKSAQNTPSESCGTSLCSPGAPLEVAQEEPI